MVVPVHAEPPTVRYFFPPGGTAGQAVDVTAVGNFPRWPVRAWVDQPGVTVEPATEKGKLRFAISPDAVPGVYLVRLHDEEGASTVRPFVVGTLLETVEKEPNDGDERPVPFSQPAVVNGRLEKRRDVDQFAIELKAGQTVVAAVMANRGLGSPMDAVLQIGAPGGFVLAQNDDEIGLDPVVTWQARRDGVHLIRVFAFPLTPDSNIGFAGDDSFVYRLTITTGGLLDHALPSTAGRVEPATASLLGWNLPPEGIAWRGGLPPMARSVTAFSPLAAGSVRLPIRDTPSLVADESSSPDQPQLIPVPAIVSGRIEPALDVDSFQFDARKGQKFVLDVDSQNLGFPLDAVLVVSDREGKRLVEIDDADRRSEHRADPRLSFTAPEDGSYRLAIRDLYGHGGSRYIYRLTVRESLPDYELRVASDAFSTKAGQAIEIPVSIQREEGYGEDIEFRIEGAPIGATLEAARSVSKDDTAKSVKLKLNPGAAAFSGPIRVLGSAAGATPRSHAAEFDVAATGETLEHLWLTISP